MEIFRAVINAPWPPLRRPCGIHRRTAGLLAHGVSPTPPSRTLKAQWRESVDTPLTVAGAATDRQKAYRVPFSPSGVIEGPCRIMSQLRERLSNGAERPRTQLVNPPPGLRAPVGAAPNIEERPPGLREGDLKQLRAPRGPNNIHISHNAVILASATTGPGKDGFSASAEMSCAEQRFGESTLQFILQQSECILSDRPWRSGGRTVKPGANRMRFEARTTAGLQTASEARPRRLTPRDDKRTHLQ